MQGLDSEHEWLAERGFRSDTLEEFGVGHSDRGMMAGHIAIPIFSADAELLAYAGRDTGTSEVVYKYPGKFRRELELYNLHRALESERYEDDGLVIVPQEAVAARRLIRSVRLQVLISSHSKLLPMNRSGQLSVTHPLDRGYVDCKPGSPHLCGSI